MGKTITLPLGMVIADVSEIGQYSLISGRDYDATEIKLSEVRNVLGEVTYDLKTVSISTNINKWAAFKPWFSTRLDESNHGMIFNTTSKEIEYKRPTDVSGYYLGHFAGYNHNVPAPYILPSGSQGTLYYGPGVTNYDLDFYVGFPEFDLRDVYDEGGVKAIASVVSYVYKDSNLIDTVVNNILDADLTAGGKQIYTDIPVDGSQASVEVRVYVGDTIDVDNVYFPTAAGGMPTITATLRDGTPTASITLEAFTSGDSFYGYNLTLANGAASLSSSGGGSYNNYSASFGQASPAMSIYDDNGTPTVFTDDVEWAGHFSIYASDGTNTEYIATNVNKEQTDYVFSYSGTFTTIDVPLGGDVGFVIERIDDIPNSDL